MGQTASVIPTDVFLKEHLLYIHAKAEAGEYTDAMAALQQAKASTANNIYVRALEQQIGNLLDLTSRNLLTEDRRQEILEPMSGIIERALGSLPASQKGETSSQASRRVGSALTAEEKAEALEQLKVKYFEQAGHHLSAGEYKLALGEIRRVFVIDPENATAQQYESVIEELLNLEGSSPEAAVPPVSSKELMHEYERALEHSSTLHDHTTPPSQQESREPVHLEEPEPAPPEPLPVQLDDHTFDLIAPVAAADEPPGATLYTSHSEDPPPSFTRMPLPVNEDEELVVFSHERSTTAAQPRKSSRKIVFAIGAIAIMLASVGILFVLFSRTADQASPTSLVKATPAAADRPQPTVTKAAPSKTMDNGELFLKPSSTSPATRSDQLGRRGTPAQTSASPAAAGSTPDRSDSPQAGRQTQMNSAVPVITDDDLQTTPRQKPTAAAIRTSSPEPEPQNITVAEPDAEPFIAVEKEPQLVKLEPPQISDIAWQMSAEAQIIVRVMIDPDGKPVKINVLKSNNTVVQNAVVNAIMKSTFTPGIMGKAPVTAWVTIPLKFKRGN